MRFHLCVLQPSGYIHVQAFDELVQALFHSLVELGHEVRFAVNRVEAGWRNVVLGAHLAPPEVVGQLPEDTVILNTEQLSTADATMAERMLVWARHRQVWDYSEANIAFLRERGVARPGLLRLGFQKELARIEPAAEQDIDVLFYGSMGSRRAQVIEALRARGLRVTAVFGVYGEQRDALIARSRVVLNLHHYAAKILEVVRVFYLMTNAKAVVCEYGPDTVADPIYLDGLRAVPYEKLVDACADLVRDDAARLLLQARAQACLQRWPQVDFTQALLAQDAGGKTAT